MNTKLRHLSRAGLMRYGHKYAINHGRLYTLGTPKLHGVPWEQRRWLSSGDKWQSALSIMKRLLGGHSARRTPSSIFGGRLKAMALQGIINVIVKQVLKGMAGLISGQQKTMENIMQIVIPKLIQDPHFQQHIGVHVHADSQSFSQSNINGQLRVSTQLRLLGERGNPAVLRVDAVGVGQMETPAFEKVQVHYPSTGETVDMMSLFGGNWDTTRVRHKGPQHSSSKHRGTRKVVDATFRVKK